MNRQQIVQLDKAHVWHPYTPMGRYLHETDPLVIATAEGSTLIDVDGRRYLDATSSWWVAVLGHNHPRLVAALKRQADKLCHTALAGMTHEPAAALAAGLVARAPQGLSRVFFSDDGSTALECALKMCLKYWHNRGDTSRIKFAALEGAFHGETIGVTALGGIDAFRRAYTDVLMDCVRVRAPTDGDFDQAVDALDELMRTVGPQLAALVVEPLVLGASGMLCYPAAFLRVLREVCNKYDVLLVADEVFAGYGRTGTFWAVEQAGITPDLLATAKGFSGGLLPMAATLASERLFEGFLGEPERAFFYGHSFAGNPLGAAVALEVLRVLDEEQTLRGIPERSALIAQRFAAMHRKFEGSQRPRGIGMIGALDLDSTTSYLSDVGAKIGLAARKHGVYLRPLGNTVYVAPPLNISLEDLRRMLDGVEAAIADVLG